MKKVNFDEYAEDYDDILQGQLNFFSENNLYFAKYKVELVKKFSKGSPGRILEFGCGTGRNLQFLKDVFPGSTIVGTDISQQSVAIAKQQNPEAECFTLTDQRLMECEKFDLIFVAGVFHHIEPAERPKVFRQLNALLSDTGALFVFEHNPYNPVTRKMVRECPFDTDAVLIPMPSMKKSLSEFGFGFFRSRYTLFVPPSLSVLKKIEHYIGWLPMGGQYFIQAKKCRAA
ncbi:MAG: class I SAM-dependent methyltransferase [Pseudomonadota bacterium]